MTNKELILLIGTVKELKDIELKNPDAKYYIKTWLTQEDIDSIDKESWVYLNQRGIRREDFVNLPSVAQPGSA